MWWQQSLWKIPPHWDWGLIHWMEVMVEHASTPLQSALVRDFVLPNIAVFGPLVYVIEVAIAVSLILGVATRLGAALGALMAVNLWLGLYNAPNEWPWTYMFLVVIQLSVRYRPARAQPRDRCAVVAGRGRVPQGHAALRFRRLNDDLMRTSTDPKSIVGAIVFAFCRGLTMNHEAAVSNAKDIADRVLAPAARQNDKEARFSSDAVKALGPAGLLGIMLPAEMGGAALGPRTFAAVVSALAEADASVAMVYLMHVCAAATIAAARKAPRSRRRSKRSPPAGICRRLHSVRPDRAAISGRRCRERRRNAAGVHITAKKSFVTSAGQADSYVVSALAPEGAGPTNSTLYLIPSGARGLTVAGPWDGLGLRANASAPMTLDDCEVAARVPS